jgi:hypothetical protein
MAQIREMLHRRLCKADGVGMCRVGARSLLPGSIRSEEDCDFPLIPEVSMRKLSRCKFIGRGSRELDCNDQRQGCCVPDAVTNLLTDLSANLLCLEQGD